LVLFRCGFLKEAASQISWSEERSNVPTAFKVRFILETLFLDKDFCSVVMTGLKTVC
jgi:hypothetical protein